MKAENMDNIDAERVPDDDAGDALLASLLEQHPDALLSALDGDGRLVAIPTSITIAGRAMPQSKTALDLIAVGSRAAALDVWTRAKLVGSANAPVVLVNGVEATCYVLDLRGRHGVLLGVLVTDGRTGVQSALLDRVPIPPRSGRIEKDEVAMISFADDRICQILGYERAELIGTRSLDLIHPDDQDRSISAWIEMLMTPGGESQLRARHRRRNGSWLWMELTNTNLLERTEGCVVTEMIDISDEMAALEVLRQREQLLSRLTEALPSGVLHVDADRRVVYANLRLYSIVGVGASATVDEQLAAVIVEDRELLDAALAGVLTDGHDADVEVRLIVPGDPRLHRCSVAIRALTDAADVPAGAVLCIDDVTDAAELRAELHRRATVDELTGCLNRSAVLDELAHILSGGSGSRGTAVVFLDLDGFKEVNDTFGHETGDQLLASAASRLRGAMRSIDVLGRLGGDEFIVVLPGTEDIGEAMRIGTRLSQALHEPLQLVDGLEIRLRCSAGVAWAPDTGTTADAIIAAADRGMYQSKRAGTAQPVYADL
jgi:diguanylate cyclase (GGDEF)-like protein/PAS domain S-box-containing protein